MWDGAERSSRLTENALGHVERSHGPRARKVLRVGLAPHAHVRPVSVGKKVVESEQHGLQQRETPRCVREYVEALVHHVDTTAPRGERVQLYEVLEGWGGQG